MTLSQKTSLISIIIVILVTAGKFLVYFISGSLTAYTEAWHGFSDFATTFFVFIAIQLSSKTKSKKPELISALLISVFLSYISLSIFYQVFYYNKMIIKGALFTGILFIIFSFTSYFLFKFQQIVGEKESSPALKADSMHSKTDMITSLITGFTLILYSRGINIDRYSAAFLAFVILSFSFQLFINTISALKADRDSLLDVFQKRWFITSIFEKINISKKRVIISFLIFMMIALIMNIFYKVEYGFTALQLRFGKIISVNSSGIYFKYPTPIDKIVYIQTGIINKIEIGNIGNGPLIWAQQHGNPTMMITGDDNFVLPYFILEYRIGNPKKYFLNFKDHVEIITDAINSEITKIYLATSFNDIILENRDKVIKLIEKQIKEKMSEIDSGIEIISLYLKDVHPPKDVAEAFEDLVATNQEQIEQLNKAKNYKTILLSMASIESYQKIGEAEIDKNDKIKRAEGEFYSQSKIFENFQKYKRVIKKILYFDMLSSTINDNKKVIIDKKSDIDLWISPEFTDEVLE
ncbi:cation transporter [bacterium]|nr:cation transporter [bacterium]